MITPLNLRWVNLGVVRGINRRAKRLATPPPRARIKKRMRIAVISPICELTTARARLPKIRPVSQPRAPIWFRCPIFFSQRDSCRFSITIRTLTAALATQKKLRIILKRRTIRKDWERAIPAKPRLTAAKLRTTNGLRR